MAGRKSRPGKKSQKRHSGGQDITILLLKENVRDRIGAVEHEMHEIRRAQPCEHEQRGPQQESMPGHHSTFINHVMAGAARAPTGLRRDRRSRLSQHQPWGRYCAAALAPIDSARSEEHTSALQSLMRTSYALFC